MRDFKKVTGTSNGYFRYFQHMTCLHNIHDRFIHVLHI